MTKIRQEEKIKKHKVIYDQSVFMKPRQDISLNLSILKIKSDESITVIKMGVS